MQPLAAIQASAFPRPLSAGAVAGRLEAFLSVARDVPGEYWTAEHFLADRPGKWEFSRAIFDPADPEKVLAYAFASRPEPSLVHLHHLMVACDHRGRGLGRQLPTELSHRAALAGAAHLRLKVHPANQRAAAFYLREGFQVVGEENGYKVMTSPVRLLQRRVGIHQPNFLPWLGFFHKALSADVFVLFDDVQFPNSPSYGNRAMIKTREGPRWLTVPVVSRTSQRYDEVQMARTNWQKILRTVQYAYQGAPFAGDYFSRLTDECLSGETRLCNLNIRLIQFVMSCLGGQTHLVRSSELPLGSDLSGSEHILAILRCLGATEYISGTGEGSRRYLREEDFKACGIRLTWQNFVHPRYPQLHGEFIPGLSILDLLMNCGPESGTIVRQRAD